MTTPNRPRGFEDRLLHEFRNHFDERNQTMTTTSTPWFSRGRKFSLAGAVGAVTLGVGAVIALPAVTTSAAYAVEPTGDGDIRIEIRGPEDADGLEDELADNGILADVEFTAAGYRCSDDWYTLGEDGPDTGIDSKIGQDGDGQPVFAIEVDPDYYELGGDRTLMIQVTEGFFDDDNAADANDLLGQEDGVVVGMFGLGTAIGGTGECVQVPFEAGGKKDDDGSKSKD